MRRYFKRQWLVLAAVFAIGVATGLNLAPVIVTTPVDPDRDYDQLQKSYWHALGWKERREEQLNDLSAKTGVPWGEEPGKESSK